MPKVVFLFLQIVALVSFVPFVCRARARSCVSLNGMWLQWLRAVVSRGSGCSWCIAGDPIFFSFF